MDKPTLSQRVERLEALAAAIETVRVGDERLSAGVERLAEETSGLNSVLTKVDEQQRALALMGARVSNVESNKASHEEVKAEAEDTAAQVARETRKKITRRLYLVVLIVVCFVGYYLVEENSDREDLAQLCEARNEQNQIIVDLLSSAERNPSPQNQPVRDSLARFRELIKDCDEIR